MRLVQQHIDGQRERLDSCWQLLGSARVPCSALVSRTGWQQLSELSGAVLLAHRLAAGAVALVVRAHSHAADTNDEVGRKGVSSTRRRGRASS